MKAAHAHLITEKGQNDSYFDAVLENLASTLRELGVNDDLINQATAVAESVRDDVVGGSA